MSSGMAGANTEQPAGTRRNSTSEAGPAARRASRATDTNTEERVAVWDAVAAYVQEHLLVQKGVWIPTFGSFDTISKDIRTADGTVTLQVARVSAGQEPQSHAPPRVRQGLPAR
ncbi:uncharacterized protein LOC121108109 isoform X2 [Gallus gallus]|uniref:uncharacterized protein LOC121108109 isoform X2 n=1 Tax=Gallus gallus TaxID=9031 RepID=UPI001F0321B8|nr:uncharacterized protein LOC121108109 isoform X2 [Gallus gallus]